MAKGYLPGSIEVQEGQTATLYQKPDEHSQQILHFYNGFFVTILEESEDWLYVGFRHIMFYDTQLTDLSGYVKRENVNISNGYLDVNMETPYALVRSANKTGEITLFDAPNSASAKLATYLDSTVLSIKGEIDDWYFVKVGEAAGFVAKNDVVLTGMQGKNYWDYPRNGYVKFNHALETISFHLYPSLNAPTSVKGDGKSFEDDVDQYIAKMGDWYQIVAADGRVYFVHSQYIMQP
jgi:hypothetical protein